VLSDNLEKDKAVELTKRFLSQNYFQTIGFADWCNYPTKDIPKGYYWELIAKKGLLSWKFDVWYITPDQDYSIKTSRRFKELLSKNPEKKVEILKLKEKYFDGVKYRGSMSGSKIYEKVLG